MHQLALQVDKAGPRGAHRPHRTHCPFLTPASQKYHFQPFSYGSLRFCAFLGATLNNLDCTWLSFFSAFYEFCDFSDFRRSMCAVQGGLFLVHFCIFSILLIFVFFQNFIENVEWAAQNGSKRRTGKSRKSPEPMYVVFLDVFSF